MGSGQDVSRSSLIAQYSSLGLGVELRPEQERAFAAYVAELRDWNTRINLTSIDDPQDVQTRHFLDSLSCLLALDPDAVDGRVDPRRVPPYDVIDVGAGAGFPGLPLKIVCPQLRLTLLESTGKKAAFLEHVVRRLELAAVSVVAERAETIGQSAEHRECYDVAVVRAVAPLNVLVELCLPLVRVGGRLVAQKKGYLKEELAAARGAINTVGGGEPTIIPVDFPGLEDAADPRGEMGGRVLVVVPKSSPTPARYPRRPGRPTKRPL